MGTERIPSRSVVVLGLESRYGFEVLDLLEAAGVGVRACLQSAYDSQCAGPYPNLVSHRDATLWQDAEFVVAVLTPGRRKQRADEGAGLGMRAAKAVVHPTSVVSGSTPIGPGSLVGALAAIGANGTCGSFFMVNRVASIGHDCSFGNFCTVGPSATICGHCVVEDGVYIGAGAVLLPHMRIGRNAMIAAGAVVVRDVASGTIVAGNPAKVIREHVAGYRDIGV